MHLPTCTEWSALAQNKQSGLSHDCPAVNLKGYTFSLLFLQTHAQFERLLKSKFELITANYFRLIIGLWEWMDIWSMLRSAKVARVHHATGQQRRQERVVMVIWIPWGYISPLIYSLHKSASSPLAVFVFFSLAFSLRLIVFVLLSLFSLSVTLCSLFAPLS